jgi:hypothetical protein
MIDRRRFLTAMAFAGVATTTLLLPRTSRARVAGALAPEAAKAAAKSTLIYVSPLLADGSESACHGEVWFVVDGDDLLVVTSPDRWRAKAIGRGLDRARIWIGDYGVWTREPAKFRAGPTLVARARIDADTAAHARALTAFGAKYSAEWSTWGPRFTDGLASGERVLIRYSNSSE